MGFFAARFCERTRKGERKCESPTAVARATGRQVDAAQPRAAMARTAATATGVGAEAPTVMAATVVAMLVAVAKVAAMAAGMVEE
eukprot:1326802-Prymnesium_polylepis.1